MRNRVFSVKSLDYTELFVVKMEEFDRMKKEFELISRKFFIRQMQQTKWILAFHLHMLKMNGSNNATKLRNFAEAAMMNESDLYSTLKFSTESDSDLELPSEKEIEEKNSFRMTMWARLAYSCKSGRRSGNDQKQPWTRTRLRKSCKKLPESKRKAPVPLILTTL